MRVCMPGTDQKAQFNIFVNGLENALEEYEVKFGYQGTNIIECYVPITPGDEITVKGVFEGTMMYGAIDLVCDGSFAGDYRTESHDGERKWKRRTFEWKKVLHSKKPDDWKSIYAPKDAAEGKLYVKTLDEEVMDDMSRFEIYDEDEPMPGLGSIEVVISLSSNELDRYFNKEWSCYIGAWRDREVHSVRHPEILPDHELGIDITTPVITRKRALKFLRHWDNIRFGPNPWARLIFYYRDIDAITEAGALPVDKDEEKFLDPTGRDYYQSQDLFYGGKNKRLPFNPEEDHFFRDATGTLLSVPFTSAQKQPDAKTTKRRNKTESASLPKGIKSQQEENKPKVNATEAAHDSSSHKGDFAAPARNMERLGGTLILDKRRKSHILGEDRVNGGKRRSGTPTLMDAMKRYQTKSNERHSATSLEGTSEHNGGHSLFVTDEASTSTDLEAFFAIHDGADDHLNESVIPLGALGGDAATGQNNGLPPASPHHCSLTSESQVDRVIHQNDQPATSTIQHDASTAIGYFSESSRGLAPMTTTEQASAPAHELNSERQDAAAEDPHMFWAETEGQALSQSQGRQGEENLLDSSAYGNDAIEKKTAQVSELRLQIKADFDRLPTLQDIRNNIGLDGIDRWGLFCVFDNNSPYQNSLKAQAEFDRRVSQVAEENSANGRFYLKRILEAGPHPVLLDSAAHGINKTASVTTCAPPALQALEQDSKSMDAYDKHNKALQSAVNARKRPAPPRDGSSARPTQRSRTEFQTPLTPTASTSPMPSTQSTDTMSFLAARKAELQRQIAEKKKRKADRDAKLEGLKKKAEDERVAREKAERLAKEQAERLAKEELERLEAEVAELDDDEEAVDEEIRRLERGQDDNDGLFGDEYSEEPFDWEKFEDFEENRQQE